jgi:hypothetical protein
MRGSIAVFVGALVLVVATATAATFPDPRGDVRGGAGPDLRSLSVSHTRTTLTFRLVFAAAPPLAAAADGTWVDMLLIGLDTPPRSLVRTSTGWRGADYYLGTHGAQPTAVLLHAEPRRIVAHPAIRRSGRTLVVSVARRAIGDPRWVDIAVAVGREGGGGGSDEAPARGAFHYRLDR